MDVIVNWLSPAIYPELWRLSRCLYLYAYDAEILYIGKSAGTTVRGAGFGRVKAASGMPSNTKEDYSSTPYS
jgi:hypothetical protein